jgi:hypothetical protein
MLTHRQTAGLLAPSATTTILPSIRAAALCGQTVCASSRAESHLDREFRS